MKREISIIKKIKLFREFKKKISDSKTDLIEKFNLRIDRSYRIYTVINIPESAIGEPYSLKKADIDKISENFTREYLFELSKYLDSKNLKELYEIYEIKKVDKFSYLVVVGFSLFRSNKYYNSLLYKILPITITALILLFILT